MIYLIPQIENEFVLRFKNRASTGQTYYLKLIHQASQESFLVEPLIVETNPKWIKFSIQESNVKVESWQVVLPYGGNYQMLVIIDSIGETNPNATPVLSAMAQLKYCEDRKISSQTLQTNTFSLTTTSSNSTFSVTSSTLSFLFPISSYQATESFKIFDNTVCNPLPLRFSSLELFSEAVQTFSYD